MLRQEMGKRIEKLREKSGLTREEVAEKAGISTKFLYEVERGKKGISAQTLLKLAQVLNASCDYILTGEEKVEKKNMYVCSKWNKLGKKKQKKVLEIINLIYELIDEK